MAEESDLERTEPASSRRLEKAREEGQAARSGELTTFIVVTAGSGALWLLGGSLAEQMLEQVRSAMTIDRALAFDETLLPHVLFAHAMQALVAFLPFGIIMLLAALAAPLLLHGVVFSWQALAPDLDRLNPLNGFRRIASWNSLVELGKSLLKTGLLGATAMWAAAMMGENVLRLVRMPVATALAQATSILGLSALALAGAMLLVAALDVPYQLWAFRHKLRMTRDELRKELKETEGDPHLKARIRSLQREAARRRMMAEIPKADVVVTNPTRYAVALRYREGAMGAPRIVAKGALLVAARIRELAEAHGVPVVQAPSLARALFRHGELEHEIPHALYTAVAELLAYVYQLRHHVAHGGARPAEPSGIEVPPGLDPEAGAT